MENWLEMTLNDIIFLQPYLWLMFGGLFVLLLGTIPKGKTCSFLATLLVLFGTLYSSLKLFYAGSNIVIEKFILINRLTQGAIAFFSVIAIIVVLLSKKNYSIKDHLNEIYFSLIIFTLLGSSLLISDNLIAFLVGVELVTICSFCLALWNHKRFGAIEATTKYMTVIGIASGLLTMGVSFIYLGSGTVVITDIYNQINSDIYVNFNFIYIGITLILSAICIELAIVPFNSWLADFYEGVPFPIVVLVGSVSKIAILIWLSLLPAYFVPEFTPFIKNIFSIIALLSLVIGSILALKQQSIKRLLAYSSIVHMGFILLAISSGKQANIPIILFYILSYSFSLVATCTLFSIAEDKNGVISLKYLQGLGRRYPVFGIFLAIIIMSLAGIPPLAGFFSKFFIFKEIIMDKKYIPAGIMAISSCVALYYYLRVLLVIFDKPCNIPKDHQLIKNKHFIAHAIIGFILFILIFFMGLSVDTVMNITSKFII